MELYKYRCSTCGKIWYEEELQKSHHCRTCPEGCDDAGDYIGRMTVADIIIPIRRVSKP